MARTLCLQAQDFPHLRFTHLTTREGLSTNQVSCAFRDSHGIMWFGTLKGLDRYDGSGFKVFLSRYNDSTSLPHNHIGRIAEDREGMLWLDADGILCRFDPALEKVIAVYRDLSFSTFLIDSEKRLWVNGNTAIYRLEYHTNAVIEYALPPLTEKKQPYLFHYLFEDRDANILVVSNSGIHRIDTVAKKITPPLKVINNPLGVLYQDRERNFWAGTWPAGLQEFSLAESHNRRELLKDTFCYSIEEWKDYHGKNYLLVTYSGGIRLIDPVTGIGQNYVADRDFPESHNISTYPYLYKDPENRIWICHTNGVDIIDPYLQGVYNIYPRKNMIGGNDWGNTISFLETGNDFRVSGKGNRGMAVFDKNWGYKNFIHVTAAGLSDSSIDRINDILSEGDNNNWYATNSGVIRQEKDQFKYIRSPSGNPAIPISFTRIITKDSSYKWVLSPEKGVCLLNEQENKFTRIYHLQNQITSPGYDVFTQMFPDNESALWVAARNGFFRYDKTADSFVFRKTDIESNDEKYILDAVPDTGHIIWFITKYAFCCFHTQSGKVKTYTTDNGFTGNNLLNVTTDELGNVWIKSNTDLACFHKSTGSFTYFNEQSGLPVDNWKQRSLFYKLKSGDLAIGGENILTALNPALLLNNKTIPPVYLEDVEIDDLRTPIQLKNEHKTIVLEPGRSNFTAHFGLLNYTLPLKNKYYYRIAELDHEWHTSTDGNVSYNHLKPGTYHLQMKGTNNIGTENSTGDVLTVIVKPHFYQTKWFFAGCGLLVIFLVWELFRIRETRRKAQQKLRDKIARDLHDDVGSSLSGINLFSKMALQKMETGATRDLVEKIADRSENMVGAMGDIVWNVNPANDSFDKLVTRMRGYALDMLDEQNIKVDFLTPSHPNRVRLGLDIRKDFYLIYKEAINNIAKYAEASAVRINLEIRKGKLTMLIEDNGKGFDTSLPTSGNGLNNMKARAAGIRAAFSLESVTGKGTSLFLSVPVKNHPNRV